MEVFINDKYISQNALNFTPQNRAFRYGDGLFESILVLNRNAHFIDYHLNRLLYGMDILGIEIPEHWDTHFFQNIITELTQKNNCKNARCKITVWRSGEGLYLPENNSAEIFIEIFPLSKTQYELNLDGIIVGLFDHFERQIQPLSACKTLNAIPYILASKFAYEQVFDDVVIINTEKKIADATSSNVFIVKNNMVYTTNENNGGVKGTMQQILIDHASIWNINVQRMDLRKEDLLMADEFFLTNAIEGIKWVKQFESKSFDSVFTKKLIDQLNTLVLIK